MQNCMIGLVFVSCHLRKYICFGTWRHLETWHIGLTLDRIPLMLRLSLVFHNSPRHRKNNKQIKNTYRSRMRSFLQWQTSIQHVLWEWTHSPVDKSLAKCAACRTKGQPCLYATAFIPAWAKREDAWSNCQETEHITPLPHPHEEILILLLYTMLVWMWLMWIWAEDQKPSCANCALVFTKLRSNLYIDIIW